LIKDTFSHICDYNLLHGSFLYSAKIAALTTEAISEPICAKERNCPPSVNQWSSTARHNSCVLQMILAHLPCPILFVVTESISKCTVSSDIPLYKHEGTVSHQLLNTVKVGYILSTYGSYLFLKLAAKMGAYNCVFMDVNKRM